MGGFEPVHVEHEWYDGPRAGIADVDRVPHYFRAVEPIAPDELPERFHVWPADDQVLAWEREQWLIHVRWNDRYEAGTAGVDTHPGHRGTDPRYDELDDLLEPHRIPPPDARVLRAEWEITDRDQRYADDGPNSVVRWHA
ncbi:hypothetical protein EV193_12117 [Herbihabitans rhizosphaerae]|uniref:Uncharacterized protein n=1 Tax=Herbihabitans rhizosphaerae TaxID=1872711 RepID=A0A4Q7KBK1_9PSEU|nr:hypothetical protein [Herbihabitans rhizosphaerae]RZS29474.1 hypothetical protein EV193_12117 [Herbihabitans rhizosphaerae]